MLSTVYLIFNAGYGPPVRPGLCAEAIRLGRVLIALMPDEPEALALLALMLLHDSRRDARVVGEPAHPLGRPGPVAVGRRQIAEGMQLVARAWRFGRMGYYLLQASIAFEHARGETDWGRILWLYDRLLEGFPDPVVALNRAVVIAELAGPSAALGLVDELGLDEYHLWHSLRADLLRRLDRRVEAAAAYREALARTESPVEIEFLERRLSELGE